MTPFFARWILLGLALAGLVVPVGPARAATQTLKMTMAAIATYYAPYLIGIEKKYFAEEGLAIDIVYAGGGVGTPALLSGSVDISTSAAASLTAILRGAALKIVYTMSDRPTYQLWSTRPELKTLQDLKGKSVGIISRGDTFEIAMRLTLQQAGLPQDWVGFTPLGFGEQARQAAIESGSLPAVIAARSDLLPLKGTPALQRGHLIVDMYKTLRWPYTGVVVPTRMIEQRPEVLAKFLLGVVKGVRYARAFKTQTIAIMKKYEPHASDQELALDYDDVIPTLTADGTASDDLIRRDLAVRAPLLGIPPDKIRPIAEIYDYGPVRAVEAKLDANGWTPSP